MKGALAIFVKTPTLSPVKTRLAKSLGVQLAEDFHIKAAKSVMSVAKQLGEQVAINGYYAVAEQSALTHSLWQDLPTCWQGEGGLGERMEKVYRQLLKEHDFVLLVGADIPQISTTDLVPVFECFAVAKEKQFIYGASQDGGFWGFGGNAAVPLKYWTEVAYSQADTGEQFLAGINRLGAVHLLATLRDVDELEDLMALKQSLLNLPDCTSEQVVLSTFLNNL